MPFKETTRTTLVVEYLRRVDDFRTPSQILADVPNIRSTSLLSLLHHLKRHHVIDAMEADGTLYWYVLDRDNDDRIRVIKERAPEKRPRVRRKPKTLSQSR